MQKWEYLAVKQARSYEAGFPNHWTSWSPPVDLNKIGSEGWELVVCQSMAYMASIMLV